MRLADDDRTSGPQTSISDAEVQKAENGLIREIPSHHLLRTPFPSRPGYSNQGKIVDLQANYFEFLPNPNLVLYRYEIDVLPHRGDLSKAPTGKKLMQIVRLWLDEKEPSKYKSRIVTDFKSTLYCTECITGEIIDKTSLVTYKAEDVATAEKGAKVFQVEIRPSATIPRSVSELIQV